MEPNNAHWMRRHRRFGCLAIVAAFASMVSTVFADSPWRTRFWGRGTASQDQQLVALSHRLRAILKENRIPDLDGLDARSMAAMRHPEHGASADFQAWLDDLRSYRRRLETFHNYRDLPLVAELLDEPLDVPWRLPQWARSLTDGPPGVDTAWKTVERAGRELSGHEHPETAAHARLDGTSPIERLIHGLVTAAALVDDVALADVSGADRERLRRLIPWLCRSRGRFHPTSKGSPVHRLAMTFDSSLPVDELVDVELSTATAIGHYLQALAGFAWEPPLPLLEDPPQAVPPTSAGQVNFAAMMQAVSVLQSVLDHRQLKRLQREIERMADAADRPPVSWPGVDGKLIAVYETPYGPILIGGRGTNRYEDVEALAIIDLGGDDEYITRRGAERIGRQPLHAIVDFGGDDLYVTEGVGGPGAGLLGIAVLIDRGGNDRYVQHASPAFRPRDHDRLTLLQPDPEGIETSLVPFTLLYGDPERPEQEGVDLDAGFAFGSGFLGIGLLVDEGGDDLYLGQKYAFGCGVWRGLGILHDTGGNDVFAAGLAALGVGINGGLGLLDNRAGDDHYQCLGTFESPYSAGRDWDNGYLSCGIGYGAAWRAEHRGDQPRRRPTLGGGIGLLLDAAGNDTYIGSSFGVAASYAGGVGAVIDAAGDDTYFVKRGPGGSNRSGWSGNHALGNGCHRGVGFLLDRSGNDRYSASGLGGGTAWDMAAGYLIDLGGSDQLTDLHGVNNRGQTGWGAAQAFAVSCFIDGTDIYERVSFGNAASYNPDYPGVRGNFSFFFALGREQNQYPPGYANNTVRCGGVTWLPQADGQEYPAGIGMFWDGEPGR